MLLKKCIAKIENAILQLKWRENLLNRMWMLSLAARVAIRVSVRVHIVLRH